MSVVDLFAGPGGWDEGLHIAGHPEPVIGIEWDAAACATGIAAGHVRIQADVSYLDPHDVCGDNLDGLVASPPCQGFSMAGKGRGRADTALILGAVDTIASGADPDDAIGTLRARAEDHRTALVLEPLRWVIDTEPVWTAWEQVPAVLPLWEACAEVLRADGYSVWVGNLTAEQYGVPQTRKRAFLLASRDRAAAAPPPTHSRYYPRTPAKLDPGMPRWVSMADALGWRQTYLAGAGATSERTAGQRPRPASAPAHTITGQGTAAWLKYEPTAANGDGPRQRAKGSVLVTVEEAGILQSFRPDYPWQGTKTARYRQVGDAVPPLLAAHVVTALGAGEAQQQVTRVDMPATHRQALHKLHLPGGTTR